MFWNLKFTPYTHTHTRKTTSLVWHHREYKTCICVDLLFLTIPWTWFAAHLDRKTFGEFPSCIMYSLHSNAWLHPPQRQLILWAHQETSRKQQNSAKSGHMWPLLCHLQSSWLPGHFFDCQVTHTHSLADVDLSNHGGGTHIQPVRILGVTQHQLRNHQTSKSKIQYCNYNIYKSISIQHKL